MEFFVFIAVILALDVAAMRWGVDSRDGFNELEWARRLPTHRA